MNHIYTSTKQQKSQSSTISHDACVIASKSGSNITEFHFDFAACVVIKGHVDFPPSAI